MLMSLEARAPGVSASTGLIGLLGQPVRHSCSPAMHNAATKELGLNWVYLAFPTPAEELEVVLRCFRAIGCHGLNVTIPHKRAIHDLADNLTPLARRIGAVNTLIPHSDGSWLGANTDVEGFLTPLHQLSAAAGEDGEMFWRRNSALVLGCGGSALAVVAGLAQLGLDKIRVAGRNSAKLNRFTQHCLNWAPSVSPLSWSKDSGCDWLRHLAEAQLIVNTTPLGMAGDPSSPLLEKELDALRQDAIVYDLIYTPRPTRLLQSAARRGCRTLDGLEMLVQQGAASLRLWSGADLMPIDAMRQAVLEQLQKT